MGQIRERTLVFIKPDGVQRGLIGTLIDRFERKGLKLCAIKMIQVDDELAHTHYRVHTGKWFFDRLITHITSSPIVVMVWEGMSCVSVVRAMIGPTDAIEAAPGTIRGDLAMNITKNLVHASDSVESAEAEIRLFFKPDEIFNYTRAIDAWIGF